MTDVTLVEQMKGGLGAPICLTWELTYACNLSCIHCLSSSGRRDPRELTTAEAKAFIDELHDLQVFYVNIGGGEPMIRRDFMEIVDYAIGRGVGVKFSTNGAFIDASTARRARRHRLPRRADQHRRHRRGHQRRGARRRLVPHRPATRWTTWPSAGFGPFKISVVMTRHNAAQLDEFKALGRRLRRPAAHHPPAPVGSQRRHVARPAPRADQQLDVYRWLLAHGEDVLTGDSFFHLERVGRAAARPQPVRRRARRVPRSIRSARCTPARSSSTTSSRRDRCATPAVSRTSGAERAVPLVARAAVGRRVQQLRQLRRVPGWLHGGQVLRRDAPRRPRPRMREGSRRSRRRRWPTRPRGPARWRTTRSRWCSPARPVAAR